MNWKLFMLGAFESVVVLSVFGLLVMSAIEYPLVVIPIVGVGIIITYAAIRGAGH